MWGSVATVISKYLRFESLNPKLKKNLNPLNPKPLRS